MTEQPFDTRKFHGVLSLTLVGLATLLAATVMFGESILLGLVYLLITGASSGTIIVAYCAKCPCKGHCGHVLPGRIATRIIRTPGPYTRSELSAMVMALAALIGVPQFWLWTVPETGVVYWALVGVALVEIRAYVCRACENTYCPLQIRAHHQHG